MVARLPRGGRAGRHRRHESDGHAASSTASSSTPAASASRARSSATTACRAGDRIIVTGTIGEHGLAVMAARHALGIEGDLVSDVAPINGLIASRSTACRDAITAMKDPTRGGVSSALHEMASKSGVGIVLDERAVPVTRRRPRRRRAARHRSAARRERRKGADRRARRSRPTTSSTVLRAHPLGRDAAIIGTCVAERPGSVILDTGFGKRLLAEPEGEPLPRIC